uniref:BAH domain-containing protein n=1 Tax=Macrostomum lignano TaxID=282301 RepID=A0A1I8FDW8_9PLAT
TNSLQLRLKRLYQTGLNECHKVLIKLSTSFIPESSWAPASTSCATSAQPIRAAASASSENESCVINRLAPRVGLLDLRCHQHGWAAVRSSCDAQISLGGDSCRFNAPHLFDGLSSSTQAAVMGLTAFTSRTARRTPQPGRRLVYYRTDPQIKGSIMNIVNCDSQFTGEGEVALSSNAESQPTRAPTRRSSPCSCRRTLRCWCGNEAGPSGADADSELTPYSGQSMSMERLANKPELLRRGDEIWAYGGVICGGAGRHICVSGDADACRYDTFRVRLLVQRKLLNGSRRAHSYEGLDSWGGVPYVKRVTVQWQFVQPAGAPARSDHAGHRSGRGRPAALEKWRHSGRSNDEEGSIIAIRSEFKRKEAVLQACKETLRQTQFAERPPTSLSDCQFKCLAYSNTAQPNRSGRSGLFIEEFTDVNFQRSNRPVRQAGNLRVSAAVYSPPELPTNARTGLREVHYREPTELIGNEAQLSARPHSPSQLRSGDADGLGGRCGTGSGDSEKG